MNIQSVKKGFTLAEVLITLSILGVVAAVTVPSVVKNYQKRITVTKLKIAYSDLSKALINIKISSGCHDIECLMNSLGTNDGQRTAKFIELGGFKNYKNADRWYNICPLYNFGTGNCNESDPRNTLYANSAKDIGYAVIGTPVVEGESVKKKKGIRIRIYTKTKYKANEYFYNGKDVFQVIVYDNFEINPVGSYNSAGAMIPMIDATEAGINKFCSYETKNNASGGSCLSKIIRDGWIIKY